MDDGFVLKVNKTNGGSVWPVRSDISVSPVSHGFGNVNVGGTSTAQSFTVSNIGSADLVLGTISLTGTNAAEFSMQIDLCSGQTVAASGSCTVGLVFSPTSAGAKSANLSIPSNDPDTPTLTAALSGNGICTYTITPTKQSFNSTGGPGSVSVTAAIGCNWTASSNSPSWITINSGNGGSGNGTVGFTVSANTAINSRTGTMTVAGNTFTVTQSGITCSTYTILPTSQTFTSAGGTGSVSVTTAIGCNWTATSSIDWVTITAGNSGSGNGTVNYSVSANAGTNLRTGAISIKDKTFTVTQAGRCSYSISPASQSIDSTGGTGGVGVTAPSGCNWAATSSTGWLSITAGNSGSGDGTVNYSVSANVSAAQRTGTITIADKTFTVTQKGQCSYSISSTSATYDSNAHTGKVSVSSTGGCDWTAASKNPSWLTITSGNSGSGNGTVNYSVSANAGTNLRTGTILIAGKTFTVTQEGACLYSITPESQPFDVSGGPGSVSVSAPSGCDWTATSSIGWIIITSGSSGSGNGTVNYTVSAYEGTSLRTGAILIKDKIFTVTQTDKCSYSISLASQSFGVSGDTGNVSILASVGCNWEAESDVPWLNIDAGANGSGDGIVSYTVSPNAGPGPRAGTISMEDETFTVTQLGNTAPIGVSLSSEGESLGSSGGIVSVDVSVSALGNSAWAATRESEKSWINITSSSIGIGNGKVRAFIKPNTSASPRTETIRIADKTFTVTQERKTDCTSTIKHLSNNFNAIGGSDSVSVSDPCNNSWTAASNASWIIIDSGISGSGDGAVKYRVLTNTGLSSRTGPMNVAGQTFTVSQEGMKSLPEPKVWAMDSDGVIVASVQDESSTIALKSFDAVSISVSLTKGDLGGTDADWWLAAETSSGWLSFDLSSLEWLSVGPSYLDLLVTYQGPLFDLDHYEVLNKLGLPPGTYKIYFGVDTIRNGFLDFSPGNLHYESIIAKIDDDSCKISLSVPSKTFDFNGGEGSFTVNDPCSKGWEITNNNSTWITITSATSGSGNSKIHYLVSYSHARAAGRASDITVGDTTFKLEQGRNTTLDE